MLDQAGVLERRRQILRIVLLVMIFATLPFYCLGFFLWATAPESSTREDVLPTATFTLIGGGLIISPTQFPTLSLTLGTLPTLIPTPFQYNPPIIVNPPTVMWYLSPTPFIFIPSSTFAPTLTFPPSSTPIPAASDTPIPPPTNTSVPLPSNTPVPPLPSNTPVPPPATNTDVPPDVILPPTDTPVP